MRRGVSRLLGCVSIAIVVGTVAVPFAWNLPAHAACFYHPPSPTPDAEARVNAIDFANVFGKTPVAPAVDDLVARSTNGDGDAQVDLAKRFLTGHGVPRNYDIALMLLYAAIGRLSGEAQREASCTAGGIEEYIVARDRSPHSVAPSRRPR